jgi:hypothetical protein
MADRRSDPSLKSTMPTDPALMGTVAGRGEVGAHAGRDQAGLAIHLQLSPRIRDVEVEHGQPPDAVGMARVAGWGWCSNVSRAIFVSYAPSTTGLPNDLPFLALTSYWSEHFGQKKSASGLFAGNWLRLGAPQFGQKIQSAPSALSRHEPAGSRYRMAFAILGNDASTA